MKSNRILAICILLIGVGFLNAQTTIYDANRWMGSDLNGTARFVGMGGAMGSLGWRYYYYGEPILPVSEFIAAMILWCHLVFDNTGTKS